MFRFIGNVRSGKGKHSELVIPGIADLNHAPTAWPDKFHPGSLNVGIVKDGYPESFMGERCICRVLTFRRSFAPGRRRSGLARQEYQPSKDPSPESST